MGGLIRKAAGVPVRKRGEPQPEDKGGLYFTRPKEHIDFIHSGCALLDCVLGGGWPLGRVSNVIGDKSTGKTLLAIEACANFAKAYPAGEILYIEAEAAFDKPYAEALGLPLKRVNFVEDIGTVEGMFNAIGEFIGVDIISEDESEDGEGRSKKKRGGLRTKPGLVIVDSLDALSDKAEAGRGISEGSFGASKARKLSEVFRRLTRELKKTATHTQIVSQIRDNIGVTFGKKHSRSGGHALDFYSSQNLWLAHLKTISRTIDKVTRVHSIAIKAKLDKCKIGFAYRDCEFNIRFGYGIDDLDACVTWLKLIGKASRVPPLLDLQRMRGTELNEARRALADVVTEEWYAIEKKFAPEAGKYV